MTDGMRNVLAATERELTQVEAEIARLTEQAEALRGVKASIERYLGVADPSALAPESGASRPAPVLGRLAEPRPRGKEAVRRLLEASPRREWTVNDVRLALVSRGWLEDNERASKATRTNLARALRAWPEEIRRLDTGRYGYFPAGGDAVSADESPPESPQPPWVWPVRQDAWAGETASTTEGVASTS
jgi:hypothetical protein